MKWTIFLFDRSSRRPVRFRAGRLTAGFAALALLAAAVGWVRLAVIAARGGCAQYAICKYRVDSALVQSRLSYLDSRLQHHRSNLKALSDYEKALRINYGLRVISDDVRMAGIGGYPSFEEIASASSEDLMVRKAFSVEKGIEALARQAELEDSLLAESVRHILTRHEQWAQTPSIRPAEGRLASRFGWRADPMGGYDTRFHRGIDLANSIGTPIYASADGIVRFIGTRDGFGKVVRIRHEATCLETIYGHLDSFKVKAGEKVKRGDLIGLMGNTGRSTGPHLHYEVRDRGRSIDPQKFILPENLVVD
ncbi:MAG: M23 family metallopeptidase [Chitinispirillaceae bacterium]|nr:M23 family metallopeptidase [Chitinispirillaceae bacterium]